MAATRKRTITNFFKHSTRSHIQSRFGRASRQVVVWCVGLSVAAVTAAMFTLRACSTSQVDRAALNEYQQNAPPATQIAPTLTDEVVKERLQALPHH